MPYKSPERIINSPFYNQLPKVSVGDILHFVNNKCNFIAAFTPILKSHSKRINNDCAIIATSIAFGTNIKLLRMAEISDMSYQDLFFTANNFIRLDTLQKANDIISNKLIEHPIFEYFNISENVIHSSSDGQRRESAIETYNSRYSPKYFGLKKGV